MSKVERDFQKFMNGPRNAAANAYVSGDATLVTELSAKIDPATFLGPGGGIVTGARNVIRTNERGVQSFAPGSKSKFRVVQQTAANGLAFWTGLQRAQVKLRGKPGKVTMKLRVTEVFRQERGAWKLIHRHADMLATATRPKK